MAICLLAAAVTAHAVSEEQAAQHSWHQKYIGKAKQILFAFKGRDRCFVSTESNAVASVDLRDGSIVWRQTLLEDDAIDGIALVPKPAAVVSLSQQGQTLRAWHAGDGALLWELFLGNPLRAVSDSRAWKVLPDVTGDGSSDIAVLSNGKLLVRTTSLQSLQITHDQLLLQRVFPSSNATYGMVNDVNSHVQSQVVSGNSGKLVWTLNLPSDWVTTQLSVTTHADELVLAVTGIAARYALRNLRVEHGDLWMLPIHPSML